MIQRSRLGKPADKLLAKEVEILKSLKETCCLFTSHFDLFGEKGDHFEEMKNSTGNLRHKSYFWNRKKNTFCSKKFVWSSFKFQKFLLVQFYNSTISILPKFELFLRHSIHVVVLVWIMSNSDRGLFIKLVYYYRQNCTQGPKNLVSPFYLNRNYAIFPTQLFVLPNIISAF